MKFLIFLLSFNLLAQVIPATSPKLTFTGYKFTEKAGVSGTFKEIKWSYNSQAKNLEQLLSSASAKIDSFSIEAGKKARNVNITNGLFKNWGGRHIEASLQDIDLENNKLNLVLKIGELTKTVAMNIQRENKTVKLTGTMDLLKLGFSDAFEKLSKICGPVHKGKDGVRKTWPTVDLLVELNLK